jgi:hypothetical protein
MTNIEASTEVRQLWLKVTTKLKHGVEPKRKRPVNPWRPMLRLCIQIEVSNVFLSGLRPVSINR